MLEFSKSFIRNHRFSLGCTAALEYSECRSGSSFWAFVFFTMCPCLPSCCSSQRNASCWLLLLWLLLRLLLMCNINHALVTPGHSLFYPRPSANAKKRAVLRSTGSAARHRLPAQAAHPQRSVSRTMRLVTSYKDHAGESTITQAAVSRRHWTLSNTILAEFTSGACTVTGHSTEQRLCSDALHCSNDRHAPGYNNKAGEGHEQQHQRSWLAEAATCCG